MYRSVITIFSIATMLSCENKVDDTNNDIAVADTTDVGAETPIKDKLAKFEPKDGEVIVFIGQELDALGGLEEYNDGYMDHFDAPSGFTMYTDIMPGLTETFGDHSFTYTGLNGIFETDNWGDGDENMSLQLADEDFKHSALAIGLAIIDNEDKIANGELDDYIKKMGDFFLSLGNRPVFLRTGFEFRGSWNRYEAKPYIAAFRRIKDKLDAQGITNVAYVWQSKGFGNTMEDLKEWYPGDEYVDWCAYSMFNHTGGATMLDFAKEVGKPIFIAEATPTSTDYVNDPAGNTGLTKEMILSNPEQAQTAWDEWFIPFFKTVNDNPKTVKAISYINGNWRVRPRWKENLTFKGIDSRLQLSEMLSEKWKAEIGKDKYLKPSDELFEYLSNPQK